MSDTYTPDEEVVREFYVEGSHARGARPHEGADEFNRFIARVKAEAWRDAAEFLESQKNVGDMMPALRTAAWVLRFRADQIEQETTVSDVRPNDG